jgi:hypothetical protein
METLPKIVHERLKARAAAVDHPDPDVLTAFSERALSQRERGGVLQHLALCAECREVVALALPAPESASLVVRPIGSKWLSWPQLRWGAIAAGVIVIGWFGVLRYRATLHPGSAGLQEPSLATAIAKQAKNQPEPLAAPETIPPKKRAGEVVTRDGEGARVEPRIPKEFDRLGQFAKLEAAPGDKSRFAAGVSGGPLPVPALSHGPKPPAPQGQQNMIASSNNYVNGVQWQAPRPAAPRPSAREANNPQIVTAQAPPAGVSFDQKAQNPVQNQDALALNGRPVTSLAPLNGNSGGEVARAKPAETTAIAPQSQTAQAYAVTSAESSNFSPSGSLVAESSRWAINPAGGLERSRDQGKTWQEMDVDGGAETSGAVNRQLPLKDSRAKVAANQKTDGRPKPVLFRAVTANGPEVWAGGSEANLYHSTDSGDHWVKVVPSWRGIELSGDILSLQFADVMHGRIVTSAAEIWTTSDDGQTWDKR